MDVRVFYDDMGSVGFINNKFRARLHEEGIQCRVFNPIFPVLNPFMNNRDHRKITVIDGLIGYTGGYILQMNTSITHILMDYGRTLE